MIWETEKEESITSDWELFEGFSLLYLAEMFIHGLNIHDKCRNASLWAALVCLLHIIRHSCKYDRWLLQFEPQCWWPKTGIKTLFYVKKRRIYARKKIENMTVHGLKCKWIIPGAHQQEHATPILSLCHGIFTGWSIFIVPFFLWKKGSSDAVTLISFL